MIRDSTHVTLTIIGAKNGTKTPTNSDSPHGVEVSCVYVHIHTLKRKYLPANNLEMTSPISIHTSTDIPTSSPPGADSAKSQVNAPETTKGLRRSNGRVQQRTSRKS